jgi:hypothetical protein
MKMKKIWLLTSLLVVWLLLIWCSEKVQECIWWEAACTKEVIVEEPEQENVLVAQEEDMNTNNVINLKVWDKTFDVVLEDNSATKALYEKLKEWYVVINAHEYWGFEKVWDLGFSLPREDSQITTEAWDIVLYNWNQISLFYDSNSWSYTKLWKVQNITKSDLWDWDVTLTFSLLK